MVSYARPGVFVTENLTPLSTGNGGIPGEATPAFGGVYPRGPLTPLLIKSWSAFVQTYGDFTTDPGNLLPFAVYQFFLNGGSQCFILRLPNSDAESATIQLEDIKTPTPDEALTINADSQGVWGNLIYVEVTSAGQAGRVNLNVYFNGTSSTNLVETFQDVSMDPTDRRNLAAIVNSPISGSKYVTVVETLPDSGYTAGVTDLALISPVPLTGGTDGSTPPSIPTGLQAGFDTLQDQILNLNVPGDDNYADITALANWAGARGDVELVVDGPTPNLPTTNDQVTDNYIALVTGGSSLPASTYLTVYAPYCLVQDPSSTTPGATRYLPPGGLVLGQWNATDIARGEVKTPAGINNVLRVVDLEARFSNDNLDTLNLANVNAIRYRPGYGFCIFGGRTLHPGFPDRYVAVRRMLMKIEHDLKWICQFALFEPNDAKLWLAITNVIKTYLTGLYQASQIGGDSVTDAFAVTCDESNNTPATAQAGIVNVAVGVNLLSPAEWIEITLSQYQGTGSQTTTTTAATSA